MAGEDINAPPKPTNEKPFGITNIKTYIPITLDLNELNYDSWSELFMLHCNSFGVLNIIMDTSTNEERTTEEWGKLDSLVKLWIFGTISKYLLQRVLKKNVTASQIWKNLKDVFHDNKSARAMQLDNKLRTIEIGSLSITEYFHKINRIADLLANIDSPMDEKNLVTYAINGLSEKYEGVEGIIRHRDPPPTFAQTQSMLLLEESRLKQKSTRQVAHDSTPSSPHVLLAAASNNRNNSVGVPLCRNFQHGSCNFGERCKYVHTNASGSVTRNGNGNTNNKGSSPQWNNTTGRIMHVARMTFSPTMPTTIGYTPQPGNILHIPHATSNWTNPTTPTTFGSRGILGPAPGQAHVVYGPYVDQATTLPQAFNAMTVKDYGDSGWYMDTGATSHLASDTDEYNALISNDCSLNRYKARLVANGRSQRQRIDCDETFSPLDVKNAFLHGHLSEIIYMHQPPEFVDPAHPHHVCLLQKSLYGLKQAPRAWFQRFASYATRVGFQHSQTDSSLFIFQQGNDIAYLLIYVDDIILTASSGELLKQIISSLHTEFSMTDLGPLNYFLGISAQRTSSGLFLSQTKYAREVLERAGMMNCNPCKTPADTDSKLGPDGDPVSDPALYRSLVGSLQYLTFTRPDLSYAVQHVCLYMHDPREPHLSAMKRILRYVRGTLDHGLQLYTSSTFQLIAYSDADWAGCPTTRRSTSGYCVSLGDNLITWSSKRQHVTSPSSAEAEYHGVANVVAETAWVRNLLRELLVPLRTATLVYYDNVSAVYLSSNPVQHQHIFTKGLPSTLFAEFRSSLSVRSPPAPTARAY
ncbi:ribonuclease H-like domain-containing protein [Tanacetum coccineum]|uniref:Ribonuclease H-like domain-containing protein n=1 Tax=Tanacetum coccineum TaxID=301880 RepID=A0ABQ5AHU2_9ASTR